MEHVFHDEQKIKMFAKIQESLLELQPNSTDEEIFKIISSIPKDFINSKNDLMIICHIFAHYGKYTNHLIHGNVIKLFEKILIPMKTHLQDESNFIWTLFDSLYYFKLMMYEEGLISIQQIILSAMYDQTSLVAEYFLPEIIENEPEIFEKEIKYKIHCSYSKDDIEKFKAKRKKYLNWVRNCCDYKNPSFREIETDALRLSIKTDDVNSFQKILSNSNMSINSKIHESIFENYLQKPREIFLIEFAINYDSINIFKFLILNDVDLSQLDFSSILLKNNEMIHIIETKINSTFVKMSLFNSIGCWNSEMIEYSMNNFEFDFLEKSDVDSSKDQILNMIMYYTSFSANFIFFDSIFLPFLRKNDRYVTDNIHEILFNSLSDLSCFFPAELMKYPSININYRSSLNKSLLTKAIIENNVNAVKMLFKYPDLQYQTSFYEDLSPLHYAIAKFSDMKIIQLICKDDDPSINITNSVSTPSPFFYAVVIGNFYAIETLIDLCFYSESKYFFYLFVCCLKKRHLFALKIMMKYFFSKILMGIDELVDNFIKNFATDVEYENEFPDMIRQIYKDL